MLELAARAFRVFKDRLASDDKGMRSTRSVPADLSLSLALLYIERWLKARSMVMHADQAR
jgi:hypothetical protein